MDTAIDLRTEIPPFAFPFESREDWLEMRNATIGGSEIAALFNVYPDTEPDQVDKYEDFFEDGVPVSPYDTPLSLWALKTERISREKKGNSRTNWGNHLETAIAEGVAKEQGITIRKSQLYYVHPQYENMGASLDFEVDIEGDNRWEPLEVKNVDTFQRYEKWSTEDGEFVIPPHIYLQIQQQLAVTGCQRGWLAVLFGGNTAVFKEVPRDEEVVSNIKEAIFEFWKHVTEDTMPDVNIQRDKDVIKKVFNEVTSRKVLDWSEDQDLSDIVAHKKYLSAEKNKLDKEIKEIDAVLATKMSDAEIAIINEDLIIKRKLIESAEISYTREAYIKTTITKRQKKYAGSPLEEWIDSQYAA